MLRDRWWFGRKAGCFTLQWHITNACELHCRHCYDRQRISPLTRVQALGVIEDFRAFCQHHRVAGHICLTGGNPLLHKSFFEIYEAAAAHYPMSILGNPCSREQLARIVTLRKPRYFQVSLEGLEAHNDEIRGAGHFARVMEFLPLLREHGVRSVVMLTLTRANIDQVLPLAEVLRDRVDRLTFNRLAQVGEGANLEVPDRERYVAFLKEYTAASRSNPILGFKDGLFNILRRHFRRPQTGGCTGHGCGAAFNFIALLPDGEAHACRKFPSPIGNVLTSSIREVYDSEAARRYRQGCTACRFCPLRRRCGGCMAVAYGHGLDPLTERDPHCFMAARKELLAGF